MALMINEYTSAKFANVNEARLSSLNLQEGGTSTEESIDPDSLMVEIEGIHAYPHATRNYTRYMPKCLKNSVSAWTNPYRRPLIKHHNEKDGETIGRICAVEYKTNNTLSGTPALNFTVNIPGEQAKKDVKSGILSTASIGVIAYDVRCSICGTHLENGTECSHERGQTYTIDGEEQTCYWDIYSIEPKELSYVIVPSDMYAKNIKMHPATQSNTKPVITENNNINTSLNITERENLMDKNLESMEKDLTEAKKQVDELTEKINDLTEANKDLEDKVTKITESNDKLQEQIKELIEAKSKLAEEKAEEIKLKEGAENALAEAKKESRKYMVETLQTMRKSVGKEELDEEIIKNRTEDSIRDSICDLKEEFSLTAKKQSTNKVMPNSVKNPGLVESEIKESVQRNIVDLQEGLSNIFTSIIGARRI